MESHGFSAHSEGWRKTLNSYPALSAPFSVLGLSALSTSLKFLCVSVSLCLCEKEFVHSAFKFTRYRVIETASLSLDACGIELRQLRRSETFVATRREYNPSSAGATRIRRACKVALRRWFISRQRYECLSGRASVKGVGPPFVLTRNRKER